jgi:hypothetical protein
MWKLWNAYRATPLWGPYGPRDAFNLTVGPDWYGTDYVGIDQGPIIIMIENYRTGSVWNRFMQNADIRRGLERIGFQAVTDVEERTVSPASFALYQNYPNPFNPLTVIGYQLAVNGYLTLKLYNVLGQEVKTLVDGIRDAGHESVEWDGRDMRGLSVPTGIYFVRMSVADFNATQKIILLK